MTVANLLIGLGIGLPMMLAVGPIAVLLLDQGLERGIRAGAPAALGVAGADLTLSVVAAVAGATVSSALAPWTTWLTLAAVGVLVWLAADLGRSALAELAAARTPVLVVDASVLRAGAPVGGGGQLSGDVVADARSSNEGAVVADETPWLLELRGMQLAGAFFGITLVNPLTVVLFASVVVAGGAGVGTAGWALGMALASLLAHGGFLVLGGVLRTGLGPAATARLRLGAAVFMAALALHFLIGL